MRYEREKRKIALRRENERDDDGITRKRERRRRRRRFRAIASAEMTKVRVVVNRKQWREIQNCSPPCPVDGGVARDFHSPPSWLLKRVELFFE